jgi:hypothetical protein
MATSCRGCQATSSFVGEGVEVVVEWDSSSKRNRTRHPDPLQDGRRTTGYNSGAIFDFHLTDVHGEVVKDIRFGGAARPGR